MPWEIDVELIEEWLLALDEATYDQVVAAMRLLSEDGPSLGRPLVDSVKASRHHHMKELRPGSAGRSEIRILFAFDPRRRAILLIAGDKRGNWQGVVPQAHPSSRRAIRSASARAERWETLTWLALSTTC